MQLLKKILKKLPPIVWVYDWLHKMPPVGGHNESNRIDWLEKTLKQISDGSRILDAGAGELRFKPFCSHLEYVSQDFAQYDGKGNGSGLQVGEWNCSRLDIVSDITDIPEPDESFDAIMCIEVFEHLPDPIKAIKEFARLLCKGGQLIITAPFWSMTHFAPCHFQSGFNRYYYEHHLPAFGFEIMEIKRNGNFFEYLAQEIKRLPSISEKYANDFPSLLERFALLLALRMLERFSAKDKGSNECTCFGYFVVAKKVQPNEMGGEKPGI